MGLQLCMRACTPLSLICLFVYSFASARSGTICLRCELWNLFSLPMVRFSATLELLLIISQFVAFLCIYVKLTLFMDPKQALDAWISLWTSCLLSSPPPHHCSHVATKTKIGRERNSNKVYCSSCAGVCYDGV